ncbi:MAG: aminotransferase class III-fold pyridoxal phosphate-dependent enzyme [Halobacteriovoraceae bacterium]|nr:aminotransferase class III-fold pyridoxal phosphate-dependent enzyme [Halobacteriovoraceae bacterium]
MTHSDLIQNLQNQLFSAILESQDIYTEIKSSDKDKSKFQKELLEKYISMKGRNIFFNYISEGKGYGPFCELMDGSVKFDLIGGIGVNLLGHGHPLYIKSHLEAALYDTIMCGNLQTYTPAIDLTKKILGAVSKSRLKHFWFAGSGSFANDTALKIIWQKTAPKYRLIAFKKSFAGRSIAMQEVTENSAYRENMPQMIEVDHVPHFDQYNPDTSLEKTMQALEEVTAKYPNQHCAITLELVQGEGGIIFGDEIYYKEIFKWAKSKGLYIWVDEVQTFGRTDELFAFQKFGLDEFVDVVTVGKALQACGTLYTEDLNPKPGLIAGTFNGSISALICGSKTLDYLQKGNFYGPEGRVKQLENIFIKKLNELKKSEGVISYIGCIGTMIAFGIEDESKDKTTKFIQQLFENGIISFMAGSNPCRIRMLLPLSLNDEHISEIFDLIRKTITEFKE